MTHKMFIFGQTFLNTYHALAHLTLGIEPMEDEEDDGNSTEAETGDDTDQSTNDGDTSTNGDTGHVPGGEGEASDQGTGQEGSQQEIEHDKQEL